MTPIPELVLSGPPRERGRERGETLRQLIAETIERWFESLAAHVDPPGFVTLTTELVG